MKVLIVSKALIVAAYRQKLVELARLGIDVHAVVPPFWREDGRDHPVEVGGENAYGLTVTSMRFNGHFHVHHYPELPSIIDHVQPDVVHLDEEPYNLATYLGGRAARRRGIPSIFFTWQNIPQRYPPPFSATERRVYGGSRGAIAGNREASSILRQKGFDGRIAVIPQFGVDPALFTPLSRRRSEFTIGFLNRLVPAKGATVLLDAFADLPDDTRLRFVGDGPLSHSIKNEIQRRGWKSRVTIESRVGSAQMPKLLNAMDVVVLPSLSTPRWKEQFGRILVEAMACSVAVVGSDSGEIPNVIGNAGLIVPEGDAAALSQALLRLRDDPRLRHDLAARGRQRVLECFTQAEVARATAAFYERVLRD